MLVNVCFCGSGVWYLFVDKSAVLNADLTSWGAFFVESRGRRKSTLASMSVSTKQAL